jgi:hypothetical protein
MNINIKKIIIENDTKINIIGRKNGLILKSLCPLIGWKYMWHSIFNIVNYVKNDIINNNLVVNLRFDILNNSNSFDKNTIINFINRSVHNQ